MAASGLLTLAACGTPRVAPSSAAVPSTPRLSAPAAAPSTPRLSALAAAPAGLVAEPDIASVAALYAFEQQKNADDAPTLAMLRDVTASSAFRELPLPHQLRVLALLGGKNPYFSAPARLVYNASGFSAGRTASEQAAILTKLVAPANDFVPKSAVGIAAAKMPAAPYGQDLWPRGNGYRQSPGLTYDVTLSYANGHSYTKGVNFHQTQHAGAWFSAEAFAQAMAVLPEEYAAFVPTYRISEWNDGTAGDTGPSDSVSDINAVSPTWRLPFLVAHETSHGAWYRFSDARGITEADFAAALAADGIQPSQYAGASTAELIAEVGVVYCEAKTSPFADEYRAIFKAQLALFARLFAAA